MDKASLEQALEDAEVEVREASRRVDRQRWIVAEFRRDQRELAEALRLLQALEISLAIRESDRNRLSRALMSVKSRP